jgi:osmotically-inducible protein OsmY
MSATPHPPAARFTRGPGLRWLLVLGLVGLALVRIPATVPGAEADPAEEAGPSFFTDDDHLSLLARRALRQDEALASLNLGVRVRQGVATLWGTAPTEDVVKRALERLKQVPGLKEAHSELLVTARETPQPSDRPIPGDAPAATEAAGPNRGSPPGTAVGLAKPTAPVRLPGLAAPDEVDRPPKPAPRALVTLGSPIPRPERTPLVTLGTPVPTPERPSPPAATTVANPVREDADPTAAVEDAARHDPRFRRLRPVVQDGVVFVLGQADSREDAVAFANAVSRLPGVKRVVLDRLQTDTSPPPRR